MNTSEVKDLAKGNFIPPNKQIYHLSNMQAGQKTLGDPTISIKKHIVGLRTR